MQTKTLKDARVETVGSELETGPILVRLLCADEPAQPSVRHLLHRCTRASFGRAPVASEQQQGSELQLRLDDRYASTRHAELERSGSTWLLRDLGSTNGTLVRGERLAPGAAHLLGASEIFEVGHTFFFFRAEAPLVEPPPAPRTLQPEWQLELERAALLAQSAPALLITGESGAGKELVARFLHERAGRPGPLVSINCAAVPEALQEDELFGHVKGAYSGAEAGRAGLLRSANGGTLLLDEIGEMSPSLQAKLLRVLDERVVRPVGSDAQFPVDVKILAATHRDIDELVEQGRFREDLKARLALQRICVPPLRDRREDLGLLVRELLDEAALLGRVRFAVEALRALFAYRWPLNVRELRSALLAAAAVAPSGLITLAGLPADVRAPPRPAALSAAQAALREQLAELLRRHGGNVSAVARELGKARTQVRRWTARFGLD